MPVLPVIKIVAPDNTKRSKRPINNPLSKKLTINSKNAETIAKQSIGLFSFLFIVVLTY